MATFDGYIRVSATKGRWGDSFISPDVQRDTIRRMAAAKGLEVGEIAEDLDVSGGKRAQERELGRLVEKIERGESAGLIVWKFTRFSRNMLDAVETVKRITDAGGRLLADDFDSKQSMGKAFLGLLAGLAEEELDARREGWDEAHRRAIERGVGMTCPIGYQKAPDGRLRVHKAEARNVRTAFKMRSEGSSLSEIARKIGRSHATVHDMLSNQIYLGTVKYGGYRKEGAHQAIVDVKLFAAANVARTRRQVAPGALTRDRLLQSIARCAGCGNTLKVVHRPLADGGRVPAYYCKNQAKVECRERGFVNADALDDFVEKWFTRALSEVPRIVDVVAANRELEDAQSELVDAEAELAAFVETASALNAQLFRRGVEKRQRRVDDAHQLVSSRSADVVRLPAGGSLVDLWGNFDRPERHDVLVGFIDRVTVRKGASQDLLGSIEIVWSDGSVADHESAADVLTA
jgi:DNA invertase Pin-like site-specific DNA recombinase